MNNSPLIQLESLPYFTIESVRQVFSEQVDSKGSIRTALYRRMKTGSIIQLKKGLYMPRRFYELHRGDPDFSPAVSAILLPNSYLSAEYILQQFGILTEATYPVTAITPKNSRVIENPLGTFSYRHIQPSLYNGFSIAAYFGIRFARASLAKALFDFFYLRPVSRSAYALDRNLAEDLRLNLDEFRAADQAEFSMFVDESNHPKMKSIRINLARHAWPD